MNDSKHNVLDPEWEAELRRGQEQEGEAGSVEDELAYVHLLRHTREPEALAPDQLDSIWAAIEVDIAPAPTPWWRKAWVWWTAPALAAAAVLIVVVVEPGKDAAPTVAQHDRANQDEKREAPPSPTAAPERRGASEPEAARAAPARDLELAEDSKAEGFAGSDGSKKGMADQGRGAASGPGSASPFEVSFAKLAPHGRLAIRAGVDFSRDELRSELLAQARDGGVQ